MNKQFAAATPDTRGTKRKAKNKSMLGSAVLFAFLHEAEVPAFQAEALPCWLQYTFFYTSY